MNLKYIFAKSLKWLLNPPALHDCRLDKTAKVCPRSELTGVTIGRYSYVGNLCFLVNTEIGAFCSIADRCCIGSAEHPLSRVSTSPVFHEGNNVLKTRFADYPALITKRTVIGNDVWIGMGCYIKGGVTIGNGAVIGMGSVVTHDVPAYEIWAGNPARLIRKRFDEDIVNALTDLQWWNFSDEIIKKLAPYFLDPASLIAQSTDAD